jgi:hypothetical protein
VSRGLSIVTELAGSSSSQGVELLMQKLDGVMCIVQCCDLLILVISKISVQTRDARRAAVELAVLMRTSGEGGHSACHRTQSHIHKLAAW